MRQENIHSSHTWSSFADPSNIVRVAEADTTNDTTYSDLKDGSDVALCFKSLGRPDERCVVPLPGLSHCGKGNRIEVAHALIR